MKKMYLFVSMLVVAVMLLTACGTAATPTAAPVAPATLRLRCRSFCRPCLRRPMSRQPRSRRHRQPSRHRFHPPVHHWPMPRRLLLVRSAPPINRS